MYNRRSKYAIFGRFFHKQRCKENINSIGVIDRNSYD